MWEIELWLGVGRVAVGVGGVNCGQEKYGWGSLGRRFEVGRLGLGELGLGGGWDDWVWEGWGWVSWGRESYGWGSWGRESYGWGSWGRDGGVGRVGDRGIVRRVGIRGVDDPPNPFNPAPTPTSRSPLS